MLETSSSIPAIDPDGRFSRPRGRSTRFSPAEFAGFNQRVRPLVDVASDENEPLANGEDPELLSHRDPEVSEADALDQAREVVPGEHRTHVSRAIDAPEADAIEQAIEEPIDLDDEPPSDSLQQ
jgi:hypothetical protein